MLPYIRRVGANLVTLYKVDTLSYQDRSVAFIGRLGLENLCICSSSGRKIGVLLRVRRQATTPENAKPAGLLHMHVIRAHDSPFRWGAVDLVDSGKPRVKTKR